MSVDASGKFGGSMVFSKWKGRNYVRQLVVPENPGDPKQLGVRAMMRFLATQWKLKALPKWTGWTAAATAKSISTFNAYVSENLARWQLFKTPTEVYPAAETAYTDTVATQGTVGNVGFATIEVTPTSGTALWGIAIFRDPATITVPSWANCVMIVAGNGASKVTYVDSPLAAGTYHYRTALFSLTGLMSVVYADSGAITVT